MHAQQDGDPGSNSHGVNFFFFFFKHFFFRIVAGSTPFFSFNIFFLPYTSLSVTKLSEDGYICNRTLSN